MTVAAAGTPRWSRLFYGGLAAVAASEVLVPLVVETDHAHFWFEDLPAWGSVYGLLSCVVIIVASKVLGKVWLARPETYYDD